MYGINSDILQNITEKYVLKQEGFFTHRYHIIKQRLVQ